MEIFNTTRDKLNFLVSGEIRSEDLGSNKDVYNIINKELINNDIKLLTDIFKTFDMELLKEYVDSFSDLTNFIIIPLGKVNEVNPINSYVEKQDYLLIFLRKYIEILREKDIQVIFYINDFEENKHFIEQFNPDLVIIDNLNYENLSSDTETPVLFYSEEKYYFNSEFLGKDIDLIINDLDEGTEKRIDFEFDKLANILTKFIQNKGSEEKSLEEIDLFLNKLENYNTVVLKDNENPINFTSNEIIVLNETIEDYIYLSNNSVENIIYGELKDYKKFNKLQQNVVLMFDEINNEIINHFKNFQANIILILKHGVESISQDAYNIVDKIILTNELTIENIYNYFTKRESFKAKLLKPFKVIDNNGVVIEQIYGSSPRNLLIERSYLKGETIVLDLKFKSDQIEETILEVFIREEDSNEYILIDYMKIYNNSNEIINVEFNLNPSNKNKSIDYKIVNVDYTVKSGIIKKAKKSKFNYMGFLYTSIVVVINFIIIIAIGTQVHLGPFIMYVILLIMLNIAGLFLVKYIKRNKYNKNKKRHNVINKINLLKPTIVLEENYEFDEDELEDELVLEIDEDSTEDILKSDNYLENIDFDKYFSQLVEYLKNKGIKISDSMIGKIFSSFLSSKLLIVNTKDDMNKLFNEISNYIGANFYYSNNSGNLSKDENFIKLVNNARKNTEEINIILFDSIDFNNLNNDFYELLEYVKYPKTSKTIELNNHNLELKDNIYIVIDHSEIIDNHIMFEAGNYATINYEKTKEVETVENDYKLSNFLFINYYDQINEEFYLDESIWKKIDNIEALINEHGEKILSNEVVNQIERFSSLYLSIDNEETRLIDLVLSSKVLPLANSFEVEGLIGKVYSVIERNFDIENLAETNKLYNDISVANGGKNNG